MPRAQLRVSDGSTDGCAPLGKRSIAASAVRWRRAARRKEAGPVKRQPSAEMTSSAKHEAAAHPPPRERARVRAKAVLNARQSCLARCRRRHGRDQDLGEHCHRQREDRAPDVVAVVPIRLRSSSRASRRWALAKGFWLSSPWPGGVGYAALPTRTCGASRPAATEVVVVSSALLGEVPVCFGFFGTDALPLAVPGVPGDRTVAGVACPPACRKSGICRLS